MGATNNGGYSSSSGDEDGDDKWREAIDSIAGTSSSIASLTNGFAASSKHAPNSEDDDFQHGHRTQQPKHYQIKAQKLLEDILEKSLEVVRDPIDAPNDDSGTNEGGIRLFKQAPPGIVFDHVDELQGPTKRPRILPGKEINEKSEKFRQQLQSIAVNGEDILAAANDACLKSLARLEAKEAAAKATVKREEERVTNLKKVRGERWLPSIANEMKLKFRC